MSELKSIENLQKRYKSIYEYLEDKTQGVSAYHMKSESQIEKSRIEKLI